VIFDVDVVGGLNLKKQLGDKALSVFVKVKNIDTLKDRLSLRGTEESTTVEKRIEKALTEMTYEDQFDHVLINDNLETALSEAQDVVNNFLKQ